MEIQNQSRTWSMPRNAPVPSLMAHTPPRALAHCKKINKYPTRAHSHYLAWHGESLSWSMNFSIVNHRLKLDARNYRGGGFDYNGGGGGTLCAIFGSPWRLRVDSSGADFAEIRHSQFGHKLTYLSLCWTTSGRVEVSKECDPGSIRGPCR